MVRRRLDRILEELQTKVAGLESRVHKLETPFEFKLAVPSPKKKGRPENIDQHDLLRRRDNLFNFCCYHWPELKNMIRRAKSVRRLDTLLTWFDDKAYEPEGRALLKARVQSLWEFTRSSRYRGDPLHIADALAGVPEISWWRSKNRCSGHEPIISRHPRSWRDYVERKFPERYRELLRAGNPEKVRLVLDRAQTDDLVILTLKGDPARLPSYFAEGVSAWPGPRKRKKHTLRANGVADVPKTP